MGIRAEECACTAPGQCGRLQLQLQQAISCRPCVAKQQSDIFIMEGDSRQVAPLQMQVGAATMQLLQSALDSVYGLCLICARRFRRRSAAAAAASAALEEGAAALRALGRKEDAFYAQVAQLQRYWKVSNTHGVHTHGREGASLVS